jgi:CelD/BcsL family acetyltransferase involved in cellulose biosynthesis
VIELRTYDSIPTGAGGTDWELLLDEDPHGSVFHSPRYLRLWHESLGQRYPVRVHAVHADGRLVGLVPDANERAGAPTGPVELRRFVGGTEVTDYMGPVSRLEDRTDVASAYLGHLAADVDWDELIADGLIRESGWPDAFRRAAAEHGLEITFDEVADVCPRVDLAGGHAAYLDRLPGRMRQELTRKTRKLAREVGGLELVEVPPAELPNETERFLAMAAESFPDKAGFFEREEIHAWFDALARGLGGDRTFRLHRLDADGMPAAMTASLVGHGEWGLYNSGFDVDLAPYAPGMVIIWLLIEEACAEGFRVFDLLRGDEAYKYRFGARDRILDRLVIGRH